VDAAFLREGFGDLSRRLQILWLWGARLRLRRELFQAEAELGLLGWEQVDFYDDQISAEVKKVQELENTQASLMNTSAELSSRKVALDEELAREKALHDEALAALAAEREPLVPQFEQVENGHRLKLAACPRFDRALEEIAQLEKQLEARSHDFMKIERPNEQIRIEAREVSAELARISGQRTIVLADKAHATEEAARLEPEVARLRAELQRIDAAAAAARERLAAAGRRIAAEVRGLDRERKKSSVHMSRLDRRKRKPYRLIGACLADHTIAPLNQPLVLEKVFDLRKRDTLLAQSYAGLMSACAAAHDGKLIGFYLLLAGLLFGLVALAGHLLHH